MRKMILFPIVALVILSMLLSACASSATPATQLLNKELKLQLLKKPPKHQLQQRR